MKLIEITSFLEQLAPLAFQESYDNSGLLLGNYDMEIHKALITLDVTEKVVEEARQKGCNLIISHHPLIFGSIKKITANNATERMIVELIKHDIAVYAIHTNLDNMHQGVNDILCRKLGLSDTRILSPLKEMLRKLVTFCPSESAEAVRMALFEAGAGKIGNYDSCSFNASGYGSFRAGEKANPFVGEVNKLHFENEIRIEVVYPVNIENRLLAALLSTHPYEEVAYDIYPLRNAYKDAGAGMIGKLGKAVEEEAFLKNLKEITGIPCIKHSELLAKKVKNVAVCGGSGSFLIEEAIQQGADVFITADIKYHQYFEAEKKLLLADIGHFESEQFVKELLYTLLIEKFPNFALLISEQVTNPVFYL